jgi:hypothetical protein
MFVPCLPEHSDWYAKRNSHGVEGPLLDPKAGRIATTCCSVAILSGRREARL